MAVLAAGRFSQGHGHKALVGCPGISVSLGGVVGSVPGFGHGIPAGEKHRHRSDVVKIHKKKFRCFWLNTLAVNLRKTHAV